LGAKAEDLGAVEDIVDGGGFDSRETRREVVQLFEAAAEL
jgi:hypothetical protein